MKKEAVRIVRKLLLETLPAGGKFEAADVDHWLTHELWIFFAVDFVHLVVKRSNDGTFFHWTWLTSAHARRAGVILHLKEGA